MINNLLWERQQAHPTIYSAFLLAQTGCQQRRLFKQLHCLADVIHTSGGALQCVPLKPPADVDRSQARNLCQRGQALNGNPFPVLGEVKARQSLQP
eukprot:scaffold213643_cov41-Prasinocladus_malaysianus.AAC.1